MADLDVERETVERHRTDEGDPKQSKVHKTARFRKEVVGKSVGSKEVKMKEVKIKRLLRFKRLRNHRSV